jgi:FkbM family methyltransferase
MWLRRQPVLRLLLLPGVLIRRALYSRYLQFKRRALRAKIFKRVVAGTITFDLQEYGGKFDVGIHSDLATRIMFEGAYEPELAKLCSEMIDPGKDAIDVGANVGFYTILMASLLKSGSRVLSLEPTPKAFQLLLRNVERNMVAEKVVCQQVAAAAQDGTQKINVCTDREEYSSAGSIVHMSAAGLATESLVVPAASLDTLCGTHRLRPGFVKIDVEGYEHHVLRGASKTLSEFRPVVLAELYDSLLRACNSSGREVIGWLCANGYRVFDAEYPSREVDVSFEGYVLAVPK